MTDDPTDKPSCRCKDKQVDQLRDLIGHGFNQLDASRMLWDPASIEIDPAPEFGASPLSWSIWIHLMVRRLGNRVRRRLGLPEEPETFSAVMT